MPSWNRPCSSHQPQGPCPDCCPSPFDPLSDESFLQLQENVSFSRKLSWQLRVCPELSAKRQGQQESQLTWGAQKALPQAGLGHRQRTGESSQVQQPGRRETDTGKKKTVKMHVGPMGALGSSGKALELPHHSPPAKDRS